MTRLTRLLALTLGLLALPAEAARELSWEELVPAGTGYLYGMPPARHDGLQSEDQPPADPLTQSMTNAPTVAELDGQEVKLPVQVRYPILDQKGHHRALPNRLPFPFS